MTRVKGPTRFIVCCLLLALMPMGIVSCNSSRKNPADAYGTESKDSADNLNRTKFNEDPLKKQTAQYIAHIYLNGLYSLTVSQKALDRPLHDTTEHIARLLVEKHKQLNQQLRQIADSLSVSIASNISNSQQEEVKAMEQHKGLDFESDYIDEMIHLHKDSYTTLLKTRESSNEQLREWSKKNIPVFEELNSTLADGRKYIDTLQMNPPTP